MRLSHNPSDPGHAALLALQAKGERPAVYLNGHRLDDFLTVDDGLGEVIIRELVAHQPKTAFRPGAVLHVREEIRTVRGRVRIAIIRPAINPNALCAGVPAA